MDVRLCVLVCMCPGFICLALRVKGNATERAKRQTRHKLETTCWPGEQGEGKWLSLSDIHLAADSLSSLYEQKVAVCGFCGKSM